MVAEANAKIEYVVQGADPLEVEELVTYASLTLGKMRQIALGKAQVAAVRWTEEYFSTSPTLPLLRNLTKEGMVDAKVIDYETTLEAGLAGDVVATVEKLVMGTLNRLLVRGGGVASNIDQGEDYLLVAGEELEGEAKEDATTTTLPLSKKGRKLDIPVLEAYDKEQV